MIISRIRLKNWRNFRNTDVPLGDRAFIVGPNASGKSNFLDAIRFLSDLAKPGGGLQKAVEDRGGLSKIRCLAARQNSAVEIEVELCQPGSQTCAWRYSIGLKEAKGSRKPVISHEQVWGAGGQLLQRPGKEDLDDPDRLTQTHLEQIGANVKFRGIARFLESVLYVHVVPQLIRHPRVFTGPGVSGDPFGRNLLERIRKTSEKARKFRLGRIEKALRYAVPQLKELEYTVDTTEGGVPHLQAVYEHWRPHVAKQRETDFSDGTLRLIGLLWYLMDGESPLLLEEPELSLHTAVVRKLPGLLHRATRKTGRQVIISTHNSELLSDKGIGGEEVLLLSPTREGTEISLASHEQGTRELLESGLTVGEVVVSRTEPPKSNQLMLFSP